MENKIVLDLFNQISYVCFCGALCTSALLLINFIFIKFFNNDKFVKIQDTLINLLIIFLFCALLFLPGFLLILFINVYKFIENIRK